MRKKLGLSKQTRLSLVQLRDGREVDLEDGKSCQIMKVTVGTNVSTEDDYEAFRALSRTAPSLQVLIRIGDDVRGKQSEVSGSTPKACFFLSFELLRTHLP